MATPSTYTLQNIYDRIKQFGDIAPIFNVPGSENEPMLSIAQDTMDAIMGVYYPWKWNEVKVPLFYTNIQQGDYAVVGSGGASLTNLAWLQSGYIVDINSNSTPKPTISVYVGREQPFQSGANRPNWQPSFRVSQLQNYMLYWGTWGAPQTGSTMGNNPVAGSVYTNPVGIGGNALMPNNPITQIQDANGNLLVLTTYGTEGSAAPLAAVNAAPGTTASGTGASTVWTVVDPNGQGFRIDPACSTAGKVYQFNLIGQLTPQKFAELGDTLGVLPDYFEPVFRNGCVAQAYRRSPEAKVRAKFASEWEIWMQNLMSLRVRNDREQDLSGFVVAQSITGINRGAGVPNPFYPFPGPMIR